MTLYTTLSSHGLHEQVLRKKTQKTKKNQQHELTVHTKSDTDL